MTSPTPVRLAALIAGASMTFALVQVMAMLGLPPGGEAVSAQAAASTQPPVACDAGQASLKAGLSAPSAARG